jgi:hypothetical protein
MNITESEYLQYLGLLETVMSDCRQKYSDMNISIERSQLSERDPFYRASGLSFEQMTELKEHFKERQHEYFNQWKKLNFVTTSSGYDRFYGNTKLNELKRSLI